jgi:aarF domain-containing kinase
MIANKVRKNFENSQILKTPLIYDARRRMECMVFVFMSKEVTHGSDLVILGRRMDDLAYLKEHHISPLKASTELTKALSQMIFLDGFVYCDPHAYVTFVWSDDEDE